MRWSSAHADAVQLAAIRSHATTKNGLYIHILVFISIVKTEVTVLWKSHSVFSDSLLIAFYCRFFFCLSRDFLFQRLLF